MQNGNKVVQQPRMEKNTYFYLQDSEITLTLNRKVLLDEERTGLYS